MSESAAVDYTVVVPAYNEELRLPRTLESIFNYLQKQQYSSEVIVVDDGSQDRTAEVVRGLCSKYPTLRLESYKPNRGKGHAVRTGAGLAKGKAVLFSDADGATPIEEIERLIVALNAGADVAIGSRALKSAETQVETVWYRKFIGRVFNTIANILVVPGIADTQCGFKMFSRKSAEYVFTRQTAERFSFDVELLFLARKGGFKIAEVPVNWQNVAGSKVNLVRDSLQMFLDMMKFRWQAITGVYSK